MKVVRIKSICKVDSDELLQEVMFATKEHIKEVYKCSLSYVKGNEIILIITQHTDDQLLCSIMSSLATLFFNKCIATKINEQRCFNKYIDFLNNGNIFISRCFELPKEKLSYYLSQKIYNNEQNLE